MKNLYDSLLLKGYSKEELMKLCENDSDLFDEEKDEFRPVTWDYIEKNYEVLELGNGKFVLNSL